MERYICVACGTQYPDAAEPPGSCPICTDPRQYVLPGGQQWTTMARLRADRTNDVRAEGDLVGIGTTPHFAIGQRALLVPFGDSNLLWDCVSLLDEATAEEVERRGGLAAIAVSHPHYYTTMVEWAQRFDCPVHLHAADADWVMRPDPAIRHWDGETLDLGHGVTLIRGGGHFPGGTMLHRADGAGDLLTGDIIQVVPDRGHVAFMELSQLRPAARGRGAADRGDRRALRVRGHLRGVVELPHPGRRQGHRPPLGRALRRRTARRPVTRPVRPAARRPRRPPRR